MSIIEFQRALCDMTLDPAFGASVLREGEAALGGYALTRIEINRLTAVVHQRGMSVNCTLARANRFAPLVEALPLTCSLLKTTHLRELLDEFWHRHKPEGYQLSGEVEAFVEFVRQKLAAGDIDHPYAQEVFEYDCAAWSLVQTLRNSTADPTAAHGRPQTVSITFAHDPHQIVPRLERDELLPSDLPAGEYLVHLTLHGDVLEVVSEAHGQDL